MTGKKNIFIQRKNSSRTLSKNFIRTPTRYRSPSITNSRFLPSSPFQVTEAMPRRPTTPNTPKWASLEESTTKAPQKQHNSTQEHQHHGWDEDQLKITSLLILLCITPVSVSFMSYVSPKHVEYVSLILKTVTCLVTLE